MPRHGMKITTENNYNSKSKSSAHTHTSNQPLDQVMFQLVPCLENFHIHLLHSITKFHPKLTKDVPFPGVVLGIHPCLNLLIIDHTNSERVLHVQVVKCGPCLLNFHKE